MELTFSFPHLLLRCVLVVMSKKDHNSLSAITVAQYDDKIKRKSFEDPLRQHRRSSIPFVDRKPAVRFIRSIEAREANAPGPNEPQNSASSKPILKKTSFPILVSEDGEDARWRDSAQPSTMSTTNDILENCRSKTDLIMDKISRAERIARGSMDVLTFPTATRRIDALSRFQGSLVIAVCTVHMLTTSPDYKTTGKQEEVGDDLKTVVEITQKMESQAKSFHATAKKFIARARKRYNDWETMLKKNPQFKVENTKFSYPLYTHKRMPESVTMYEDNLDDNTGIMDGYVRIVRQFPEDSITIHYDTSTRADEAPFVSFESCPMGTQAEILKFVTTHGNNLVSYSDQYLGQGLDMLMERDLDDAMDVIKAKICNIQYDDSFDPLCLLELKNALGELSARKAELLNTAEQVVEHSKHIWDVSKLIYKFTKKCVRSGGKEGCSCFGSGTSKRKLLHMLGMVSVEDISVVLPLTLAIAQDVFHMEPFHRDRDEQNDT